MKEEKSDRILDLFSDKFATFKTKVDFLAILHFRILKWVMNSEKILFEVRKSVQKCPFYVSF